MSRPAGTNAWYVRRGEVRRGRVEVRGYLGDRYPDGQVVHDDPPDLDGATPLWHAWIGDGGELHLDVDPSAAAGAADLWWVALPDQPREPTQVDLVAFDTPLDGVAAGRVLTGREFAVTPVRSATQAGAVRWSPTTGIVDQLFVQPDRRRQHLATALVYAASGYHQAHRWPGALRTDGRRTELGQRFVVGLRHADRIAPWTDRAHPMDPDTPR